MLNQATVVQCPEPIETAELHFKAVTKLKIFNPDGIPIDGNTSLLAVSQRYGLIFVGTLNGFLVLKAKEVFTASSLDVCHQKEVLLHSRPTHLAVDHGQKYLAAVGSQTKIGMHMTVIFLYDISAFNTEAVWPMKTIPLSKPNDNPPVYLMNLIWQPNADSGLISCFSDGSVTALNLFQGNDKGVVSLPNTVQARCLCWSPKGKQVVIGCGDGSLHQYKPDLSLVKNLSPPPLFNHAVTIVNVLWISNLQFAAAYKDTSKPEEFPVIVIVNAPKNEPMKFVNYDDITYSTVFRRAHQLYFHHLTAWNLIFIASGNSIEVAVLHAKEDNLTWEQWLLGDASRAELPLNNERSETFPVGLAVDTTSDEGVQWGEGSLPPMPRLLLLSTEGLLIGFNIINTNPNAPRLCSPPTEHLDDSWFQLKDKNAPAESSEGTTLQQSPSQSLTGHGTKPTFGFGSSPLPCLAATPLTTNVMKEAFATDSGNDKVHEVVAQKQHDGQDNLQSQFSGDKAVILNAQLEKSRFPFLQPKPSPGDQGVTGALKSDNAHGAMSSTVEAAEKMENSSQSKSLLKPNETISNDNANDGSDSFALANSGVDAVQAEVKIDGLKASEASPVCSTPEMAVVDESVYANALLDEVDHFNSELKGIVSRISELDIEIGTKEEKESLKRSLGRVTKLSDELSEITSKQQRETYDMRMDVMEAFAWLEDAKSRNCHRKSPVFVHLKKSEELDPKSSALMKEINHLKYYIENQLKQLYGFLDKEWMEHQDKCRLDIKIMMAIPSMEDLYKTLHLELKILNKQRELVEDLKKKVAAKNRRAKYLVLVPESAEKNMNNNMYSEWSKLADAFLKMKMNEDEVKGSPGLDPGKLLVKNQINAIVTRSAKCSAAKQNALREVFIEREMVKTRPAKAGAYGGSSFIRQAMLRRTATKTETTAAATTTTTTTVESRPDAQDSTPETNYQERISNVPAKPLTVEQTKNTEKTDTCTFVASPAVDPRLVESTTTNHDAGKSSPPVAKSTATPASTSPSVSVKATPSAEPRGLSLGLASLEVGHKGSDGEGSSQAPAVGSNALAVENPSPTPAVVEIERKEAVETFPVTSTPVATTSHSRMPSSAGKSVATPIFGGSTPVTFSFLSTPFKTSIPEATPASRSAAVTPTTASTTTTATKPKNGVKQDEEKTIKVAEQVTVTPVAKTNIFTLPGLAHLPDLTITTTVKASEDAKTREAVEEKQEEGKGSEVTVAATITPPQESILPAKTSNSAVVSPLPTPNLSFTQTPTTNIIFGAVAPTATTTSSIFGSGTPASTTTSPLIFGAATTTPSIFSTTSSSLFFPRKPTTTAAATVAATTTTITGGMSFLPPSTTGMMSRDVFGRVTAAATTTAPTFGVQPQKEDVDKTAELFGPVVGGGMASGSVFGASSPEKMFDKFSFADGGGSAFGSGTPTTTATTTMTTTTTTTAAATTATSIFGSNSTTVFSKSVFSFPDATASSTSSNIFGRPQSTTNSTGNNNNGSTDNSFFNQKICLTFPTPNASTAPPANPFNISGGFGSKPIFGQSLFGQSNTGQKLFGASETPSTNIFGGSSTSTSTTGNLFQSNTSSTFGGTGAGALGGGQATVQQSGFGGPPTFQKPLAGGFGGAPVFGSGLATTPTFGAPPTFGGAPTFSAPASFGNPQKVFGSQSTFGQNQTQATNFETLASQTPTDGFANLAQQSQSQAFGGNAFNPTSGFNNKSQFGGNAFCGWR